MTKIDCYKERKEDTFSQIRDLEGKLNQKQRGQDLDKGMKLIQDQLVRVQ